MSDNMSDQIRGLRAGSQAEIWESAKALITTHDEIVDELMKLLANGQSPDSRAAAAYVIGFCRLIVARDSLERSLKNTAEDPLVRGHAAEALGYLGVDLSVDTLIAQLDDPDICVRYWCVFALGSIGEPRAVPALQRFRESLSGDERCGQQNLLQEVVDALKQIADKANRDTSG